MKILYDIATAFKIGKECIDSINNIPNFKEGTPWKISVESLKNTLNYIYEELHHVCYLMCVFSGIPTIYKLEHKTTSPFFKKLIEHELKQLDTNKIMTTQQKQFIRNFVKDINHLRILQCIVKKIQTTVNISTEYESFFKKISLSQLNVITNKLPNGVFILNLTDAIILQKNKKIPFPIYRQNNPPLITDKYISKFLFIPIFSLSGREGYWDIPIPNYDEIQYVLGLAKYDINKFHTKWYLKNISKAVFRGGPSGCGTTPQTNQRLALIANYSKHKDLLDVGIIASSGNKTINSQSIRFDPIYGLSMMNTTIKPAQKISYEEQSRYKYIIHIDGNVNAYRLISIMATGSLILRVMSSYTSWADKYIKPGIHYLPIKADLSDLLSTIKWCKNNDIQSSQIAQIGLEFARHALTFSFIQQVTLERMNEIIISKQSITDL